MTKQEFLDNGWEVQLCKIGNLYFKDGFFCRFKDHETVVLYSVNDDMKPLGNAKSIDELDKLKKDYYLDKVKSYKLQYEIAKRFYEETYNEKID